MNKTFQSLVIGATLATLAGPVLAQAVGKVDDQIRWRQAAYHTMAWSMARINANLEGQYNREQVIEASNVISALANSRMGALYQPGSDKGRGFKETRLKPEFFANMPEVGRLAGAFGTAANEMSRVAATGDAAAVRTQFGALRKTCKDCHDRFRKEE